jgi:hypothetical protein
MSIMPVSEHLLLNTAEPLYIYFYVCRCAILFGKKPLTITIIRMKPLTITTYNPNPNPNPNLMQVRNSFRPDPIPTGGQRFNTLTGELQRW